MNKFNLSKFLTENKLTQLGRLSEMGGDPKLKFQPKDYVNIFKYYGFTIKDNSRVHFDGFDYKVFNFAHRSDNLGNKEITLRLPSRNDPDFNYQTEELSKVLKSGTYTFALDNFALDKLHEFLNRVSSKLARLGNMNELTEMGDDSSEGYMGTEYESSEDMAVDMAKKGVYEEESEVEEDYSKYGSVEELMKQIETSTNEAAMKHKMERVKKAYESLESTATSLEEGEHASYISDAKLKEMKISAKKLRGMHDKLVKEYDKKYASKKKVELKESLDENEGVKKPLSQLTFADVVAAFPSIGQMSTTGFKTRVGINFPNADDSENVVYREQDFENWKAGLMSQVPDATIELNSMANKVIVHGEEYATKRDSAIASKQLSMDRMFKK
jgi:hypothetical protein